MESCLVLYLLGEALPIIHLPSSFPTHLLAHKSLAGEWKYWLELMSEDVALMCAGVALMCAGVALMCAGVALMYE